MDKSRLSFATSREAARCQQGYVAQSPRELPDCLSGCGEVVEVPRISPITQTWVQNAYMPFFGGFLLLSARLAMVFDPWNDDVQMFPLSPRAGRTR